MEARPANTHLRQIRRRVPPERRQRAEISCDRCRNKRCKCIRSSTTDTCQACRNVGQPCQTTRSRKYNSALAPFEDPRFDTPQPQSIQSLHPPTSPPAFDLVSAASSEPPTTSSRAPLPIFNMPTERLSVDPPLSTVDHIPSSKTTSTASGLHLLVYDPSTVDLVSLTTTDPVSSLKSEAPARHGTGDHNIDLPPREVADTLIKLFFDKVHCDFPILHRTLFQVHYEKTRASTKYRHDHQYTPKPDPAWLVCLFMVFVLGLEVVPSALSPSSTPQGTIRRRLDDAVYRGELQKKYLTKSKELLLEVLAGTLLVHVQALLLYCRYLHITCSRDACWNLSGAAIRIAVAIGLNCAGNQNSGSSLDRELRYRVWWTLYSFEAMECSFLGRPSAIDDATCNASLTSEGLPDMADIMPRDYVAAHTGIMRLLKAICKHQCGRTSVYGEKEEGTVQIDETVAEKPSPPHPRPAPMGCNEIEFAQSMTGALNAWYECLPVHLRLYTSTPKTRTRAILLLNVQHCYTIMLLYQPFLLALINPTSSKAAATALSTDAMSLTPLSPCVPPLPSTPRKTVASNPLAPVQLYAHHCLTAAETAVYLLDQLSREGQFNSKTWWDVYLIEAVCKVLSLGRMVDDRVLCNGDSIVQALNTCVCILDMCRDASPPTQHFAKVADLVKGLEAEAKADVSVFAPSPVSYQKTIQPIPQPLTQKPFPDPKSGFRPALVTTGTYLPTATPMDMCEPATEVPVYVPVACMVNSMATTVASQTSSQTDGLPPMAAPLGINQQSSTEVLLDQFADPPMTATGAWGVAESWPLWESMPHHPEYWRQ